MEFFGGKDTQLCDDAASDELMGGDIEGRIPNPNSYRGEKGGKKAGMCFCESPQVVVTCPPTPMVVVGVREFLRIWGYLPQKCPKTLV